MTTVLVLVAIGAAAWVVAAYSDGTTGWVCVFLALVLLATAAYRFDAVIDDAINTSPQGRAANARATIAAATAAVAGATAESELRALERAAATAAAAVNGGR